MAQYENWLKTDLDKLPQIANLGGYTFSGDALSVKVGVIVTKSGVAETLTGDVTGYVIRPDGVTVVITGDKSTNRAWVELPESAFSVSGLCSLAIRITFGTDDSNKVVLGAATFNVKNTSTTTVIDPGSVVPTYEELIEAVEAVETDTQNLETAIGDLATIRKEVAKRSSVDFTFSGYIMMAFFCCGANANLKCILLVSVNSSGVVNVEKIGTGTNITTSTDTNKLTVNNTNSSAGMQVMGIRISSSENNMPT